MNGRDTKSILLVTLALLTAASSPLNIYGEKLQDARRWYERGREAMRQCHPQRGAGDARENCAPLLVAALGPTGTRDWRELREKVLNTEYMKWVAWALTLGKGGGVPTEIPSTYDWWEMANAFFNCPDPKTQPEFLYRRGSLVQLSENCLAADSTEVKLVSFVARRVADASDGASGHGEMLGFGFGCDF